MSQPQGILTESSHNIVHRGVELTPSKRGYINGLRDAGMSIRAIAAATGIPKSTISDTIHNTTIRIDERSQPRQGRNSVYSQRDVRAIKRIIQKDPFITYADLIKESTTKLLRTTVKTIIRSLGYHKWRARRRPRLDRKIARLRFE